MTSGISWVEMTEPYLENGSHKIVYDGAILWVHEGYVMLLLNRSTIVFRVMVNKSLSCL